MLDCLKGHDKKVQDVVAELALADVQKEKV
jgi:hypothetical protein